ncbi:hypothetical protein DMB65_07115 [Flavobacterium cheongpyeongense]|uniref:Uncharacterized protein n=1 Tax=Flavobacterium cheongpyeongense TaxID=2212651 RepID=A0A2V4BRK8_9FLAO|nr:hypothetical protein [Flavobacterium cheongpyeongense]PXY41708.1 hypothetical protein DMB65_07115 [Flavobacterium cheongpyeongense]
MNAIVDSVFFNDKNYDAKKQLFFAACFPFFTIFALGIDSVSFTAHYFDGRQITNILAILYFSFFFWFSGSYLRKLMFVMVFLSYIGELIFCTLLGMYHYRTTVIPLYVPFGHAIVYASGYVYAYTQWAVKNDHSLKKYFAIGFLILFLSVGITLKDIFSLIFGIFFFLLLKRKKWQNLYYFIAICVIFIELVGTYFQCWKWIPKTFGLIPAANPPMGAVFFYAGGDVLLSKIVDYWKSKTIRNQF